MQLKSLCFLCILIIFTIQVSAQNGFNGGFMDGFDRSMVNFRQNMANMRRNLQTNLQNIGQRIAEANQRRARKLANKMENLQNNMRNMEQKLADASLRRKQKLAMKMEKLQKNLRQMEKQIAEENERRLRMLEPYTRDLRPGEGRWIDDGKIKGYVYKNRHGGISYSIRSGASSTGYMRVSGPFGTIERRW